MLDRPTPVSNPAVGPVWRPKRVLITRSAEAFAHGRAMVDRAAALGADVIRLKTDRLGSLLSAATPRDEYRQAKSTLAVVVASPAKRRLQPIPPSADWRFDLAEGCPAHCQYCYLAGSLAGPPVTRAYANIDEILDGLPAYMGQGTVTSASVGRAHEGTTFEASCYTDPLGIEHLTGSLVQAVGTFGRWEAPVQLRFTTKFADVSPLIGLRHNGRVRVRMSVTPAPLVRFEGGTSPLKARLEAIGRLASDGYRVGLTVAPIQAYEGWRAGYADLFAMAAQALSGVPEVDLTVELITHRFTPKSQAVLRSWYPGSDLDLDEEKRVRKLTKFGSVKHVYPTATMKELRGGLTGLLAQHLPMARLLYWT